MSKRNQKAADQRERELIVLRRELEQERRRTVALEREVTFLRRQLLEVDSDHEQPLRVLREKQALNRADKKAAKRAEELARTQSNSTAGGKTLEKKPTKEEAARAETEKKRARTEERLRISASRRAQHYRRGSFLRYLWEAVSDALPVRIISQLLAYLRRLRVIRLVAGIVLAVVTLVLVTVMSAAMLPFMILGTGTMAILGTLRSKRQNRLMREALEGKHLRILVPARGTDPLKDSFFVRSARAMAQEEGVAVLIVSPYAISKRGAGGQGAFFTARKEGEDLYLVRRHYYFILRRRVLDVVDPDMTVIY